MRRRDVIAGVGAVALWPLAAQGQTERVRRIGVLLISTPNDAAQRARNGVLEERLKTLGWSEGRNLHLDYRYAAGDMAAIRQHAAELVVAEPDLLIALGTNAVRALMERTRLIPIVFLVVPDPVTQGIVQSLPRPGGNVTGLSTFDNRLIVGKWVATLKELAPGIRSILFIDNPGVSPGWLPPLENAARALALDLSVVTIRDMTEFEAALAAFARSGAGGVVIPPSPFGASHYEPMIAALAARQLPAIWSTGTYARAGGLVSYGPDYGELFNRTADIVDRVLRGTSPAEIPVQNPDKFELVVNLGTAKALGLTVPPSVLLLADEVIE